MADLFTLPVNPLLDANGEPISGGLAYFYLTGTTTSTPVYTAADLATPITQPVVADSAGRFADIYLNPGIQYAVVLKTPGGSLVRRTDPLGVTSSILDMTPDQGADFLDAIQANAENIIFNPHGSPQSVADKLAPSPQDFGAAGVSATVDTAALQAFLNLGGQLEILKSPAGGFLLNDTLRVQSNTSLKIAPGVRFTQAAGSNKNLITNQARTTSSVTVTATWNTGWLLTLAWTAHGLTTSDFAYVDGADQGAFHGTFPVVSVTDANTVVVKLERLSTAGITGTITARKADQNITIDGGQWDYNVAQNGDLTPSSEAHIALFNACANIQTNNMAFFNAKKYCLFGGGLTDWISTGCNAPDVQSDFIKIIGPTFRPIIENTSAKNGDDYVSLQPYIQAAFIHDRFSWGDILSPTMRNLHIVDGATNGVRIYPAPSGIDAVIGDVLVDGVTGQTSASSAAIFSIFDDSSTTSTSPVGFCTLRRINAQAPIIVDFSNGVCDGIDIELIDQCRSNSSGPMIRVDTNARVINLVDRSQIRNTSLGAGNGVLINGGADYITFVNRQFESNEADFLAFSGTNKTTKAISFVDGCRIVTTNTCVIAGGGVTFQAPPVISIDGGSSLSSQNIIQMSANAKVGLGACELTATQNLVYAASTGTVTVAMSPATSVVSGQHFLADGSALINPKSWELIGNVNATYINGALGNRMTTNTLAGTIPANALATYGADSKWHGADSPVTQTLP